MVDLGYVATDIPFSVHYLVFSYFFFASRQLNSVGYLFNHSICYISYFRRKFFLGIHLFLLVYSIGFPSLRYGSIVDSFVDVFIFSSLVLSFC